MQIPGLQHLVLLHFLKGLQPLDPLLIVLFHRHHSLLQHLALIPYGLILRTQPLLTLVKRILLMGQLLF